MKKIKDYSKLKFILEIVAVIFLIAVAFGIRVIPSYNVVFQGNTINYSSVDDYFYMRIVDNMMVNWPNFTTTDLYRNYPEGVIAGNTRLFHPTVIAGISKITEIDPNLVAAWLSPIYGILSILCLYFMTRFSFNRGVALIALAFLATIPGEFASRTSLGAIDQHCLEIFLSSFLMSFLVLSLTAKSKIAKVILAIIAGIGMLLYMKAWDGAALFVAVITVAIFVWWIIETIKEIKGINSKTSVPYMQILICAGITISVLLITGYADIQLFATAGMALGTVVLWLLHKAPAKLRFFVIIPCIMAVGIGWIIFPSQTTAIFDYVARYLKILTFWSFTTATAEEAPLFITNGEFSLATTWTYFAGIFYFFLASMGIMSYYITKKENKSNWILILIWGIVLFIATMAMKRSAYYMAVPVCIIGAYFCWLLYIWIATVEVKKERTFSPGTILIITTVIAILSIIPSIQISTNSGIAGGIISPGWREATEWMKTNTVEPIENGYSATYSEVAYPETAYGIMTWWDYGYWILREGHRMTYSDPGGGNRRFCGWFLSTDNITEAIESTRSMKIKYIIIDYSMTTGKNYSIVQHAAETAKDFQEPFKIYYDRKTNNYNQMQINYPSYYKELMVRLYNFNGVAVDSPGCPVFRYEEIDGNCEIIEAVDLPDYDTAVSYVAQHKDAKYIIGGTNPFLSPIKMEALPQFKPVFFSRSGVNIGNGQLIPEVKIFEVIE